jgi:hypothetical protein
LESTPETGAAAARRPGSKLNRRAPDGRVGRVHGVRDIVADGGNAPIVLKTPIFGSITIRKAVEARPEILPRGSACDRSCPLVSFVASPQASSTSIEADKTAKPFFDGRPIQAFFNIG